MANKKFEPFLDRHSVCSYLNNQVIESRSPRLVQLAKILLWTVDCIIRGTDIWIRK